MKKHASVLLAMLGLLAAGCYAPSQQVCWRTGSPEYKQQGGPAPHDEQAQNWLNPDERYCTDSDYKK